MDFFLKGRSKGSFNEYKLRLCRGLGYAEKEVEICDRGSSLLCIAERLLWKDIFFLEADSTIFVPCYSFCIAEPLNIYLQLFTKAPLRNFYSYYPPKRRAKERKGICPSEEGIGICPLGEKKFLCAFSEESKEVCHP